VSHGDEVIFENDTARIAVSRNVVVAAWADAPRTTKELREFERAGRRVSQSFEKRAVFANVIYSGTPMFSQEVRDEVTRMTRTPMFHLGTAQIILVQGLAGVAVRAFLSTSFLLSRTKIPNKVFGDLGFGVDWLHGRLCDGPIDWKRDDVYDFIKRTIDRG
jgi:hypothetical protein